MTQRRRPYQPLVHSAVVNYKPSHEKSWPKCSLEPSGSFWSRSLTKSMTKVSQVLQNITKNVLNNKTYSIKHSQMNQIIIVIPTCISTQNLNDNGFILLAYVGLVSGSIRHTHCTLSTPHTWLDPVS